jgi:hypothetical protein
MVPLTVTSPNRKARLCMAAKPGAALRKTKPLAGRHHTKPRSGHRWTKGDRFHRFSFRPPTLVAGVSNYSPETHGKPCLL